MTEQKEEFYIKALMDHVLLDSNDYYKIRRELRQLEELKKQVEIYRELLDTIVWQ